MRTKDIKAAEQFGILKRCRAFEHDLLKIKDIVPDAPDGGIPFDLDGFFSGIFQVIVVPKYDIRACRDDYYEARRHLRESVTALARKYDLHPLRRQDIHHQDNPFTQVLAGHIVLAITPVLTFPDHQIL